MRHTSKNQQERKRLGRNAEDFIAKFLKAKSCGNDAYDLETNNSLIEVKSCRAFNFNSSRKSHQFGRFQIDTNNHIELILRAIQFNKKPIYAFVVRIENHKIFKLIEATRLTVPNKDYNYLSWVEVFK
jgi:hypothetical protein